MVSKVVFCLVLLMNMVLTCKAFTEVYSIAKDSNDNSYYVGNEDSNYFIAKRNAGCEIQWASSQGSTSGDDDNDQNTEILFDVSVGVDGLIYAVGSTRGNFSDPTAEAPNLDAAVIVYNPNQGDVILQKQYDIEENLDNVARAVIQKANGNLLVGVIGSTPNVASSAVYTTRILEIDSSSLEVITAYTIEVTTTEAFLPLQGGPVIIDFIYDDSSNSIVTLGNILGRGILWRYSLDTESVISQIEWGTLLGSNQISGLTSDENGEFYVVGSSSSNILNNGDLLDNTVSASEFHAYVIKFSNSADDSLSTTWVRQLSSSGSSQSGNDITIDPVTGEVVVIGSFTADFAITDSQTGLSFELDNVKDDGLTDVFIWYLSASSGDYSDLRRSSIASTDAEDQGNVVEVLSSRLLEIGGVIDDGSEGNPVVCDSSNLLVSPSASPAGSPSPTPSSTPSPSASQSLMILTASPVASEAQVPLASVTLTSPSPSISSSMPISSQMSVTPSPTLPGVISEPSPSPGSSQAFESPPPSASSTLSGNPISPAPSPSELVPISSASPSSIFIDLEIATPVSSAVVTPSIFASSVSPQATRISFVSATPSATGQLASITQETATSTVELISPINTIPVFSDQTQETTAVSFSESPFPSDFISIDEQEEIFTPEASSTFSPPKEEDEINNIDVPQVSNSVTIESSQPADTFLDMEELDSLSISPEITGKLGNDEETFTSISLIPSTDPMIGSFDEEFTPEISSTLYLLESSELAAGENDEDISSISPSGVSTTTIPTQSSNPISITFSSSTPSPSRLPMETGDSTSSPMMSSPVSESPTIAASGTFSFQPIASIEMTSSSSPIVDDTTEDDLKLQSSNTLEPFSVFPDESFALELDFSSPEEFLDNELSDPSPTEFALVGTATPLANISTIGPIAASPSGSPEDIVMVPLMSFSEAPSFDFFDATPLPEITVLTETIGAVETTSDFPTGLFPSSSVFEDSLSPSRMPLADEEDMVEPSATQAAIIVISSSDEDFLTFDASTSPIVDSNQLPSFELSPNESTETFPVETMDFLDEDAAAVESDEAQIIDASQLPLPDITFTQFAEIVLPSAETDLTAAEESTSVTGLDAIVNGSQPPFASMEENMLMESLVPSPTVTPSLPASRSPVSSTMIPSPSPIGPTLSLGPMSTPILDTDLDLSVTEEISPEIESAESTPNITDSEMAEPSGDISDSTDKNIALTPTMIVGPKQSPTIDIPEISESPLDLDDQSLIDDGITSAPTEETVPSVSPYESSLDDISETSEDPVTTEDVTSISDDVMLTPTGEEAKTSNPIASSFPNPEASEIPQVTEQMILMDDDVFSTPTDEGSLFNPQESSQILFEETGSPQITENFSFPPNSEVSPTLNAEKDFSVGPQESLPISTPQVSNSPLLVILLSPSPSKVPVISLLVQPSVSAVLSVSATFTPSSADASVTPFESSSPVLSVSNVAASVTDVTFISASPSSSPQPLASFDGTATLNPSVRPTPMGPVEIPNISPEQSSMLETPASSETNQAQPTISGAKSVEPSFSPEETPSSELSQSPLLISTSPIMTELTVTNTPNAFTSETPLPSVLESSTPSLSVSLSVPSPSQGDRELPSRSSAATPSALPSVSSPEVITTPFETVSASVSPSQNLTLGESPNPSEEFSIAPTETQLPQSSFVVPTATLSVSSTITPAVSSSMTPSMSSSMTPSMSSSMTPSMSPSMTPSMSSSMTPSMSSSMTPSMSPSMTPSMSPSMTPSMSPSITSFVSPTITPSVSPTVTLSMSPSMTRSLSPTVTPSVSPLIITPVLPTRTPSVQPTRTPSVSPSLRASPEASQIILPTVTPTPLASLPVQPTITPTPSSLQTEPLSSVSPTITPAPSVGPNVPTPSVIATPMNSFVGEAESPTPNMSDLSAEPSLMESESPEEGIEIEMPTESSSPEESMELECEVGPEQHNVDQFETTNNFQRVLITIQIAGARLLEICQLRKQTAERLIQLSAANTQSESELWFITSLTDGPAIIKRDFELVVVGNGTGLENVNISVTPSPSPSPDLRPNLLFPGSVLINVTAYLQSHSTQLVTGPYLDYVNSQNIVRVMLNEGFREVGYAEVFTLPMIIDEKQTVPQIEAATSNGSAVIAIFATIGVTTIAVVVFTTFQLVGTSGSPMGPIIPV